MRVVMMNVEKKKKWDFMPFSVKAVCDNVIAYQKHKVFLSSFYA